MQLFVAQNTTHPPVKAIFKNETKNPQLLFLYLKFISCSLTYSTQRYLSTCVCGAAFLLV